LVQNPLLPFIDNKITKASFLDFGDFSSLEIDTSGKSVHVQTTLFKPQDCFKRCEKKFQISNQVFFHFHFHFHFVFFKKTKCLIQKTFKARYVQNWL